MKLSKAQLELLNHWKIGGISPMEVNINTAAALIARDIIVFDYKSGKYRLTEIGKAIYKNFLSYTTAPNFYEARGYAKNYKVESPNKPKRKASKSRAQATMPIVH